MVTAGRKTALQKLRAGERRDLQMSAFCEKMAKSAKRADSPVERRDAGYWLAMAAYFRDTAAVEGRPERRMIPNTHRLEFLLRAEARVAAEQVREIAELRARGVSWQLLGDAAGLTRQGAQRRWGEAEAALRGDLEGEMAEDEINQIEIAAMAEALVEQVNAQAVDFRVE